MPLLHMDKRCETFQITNFIDARKSLVTNSVKYSNNEYFKKPLMKSYSKARNKKRMSREGSLYLLNELPCYAFYFNIFIQSLNFPFF